MTLLQVALMEAGGQTRIRLRTMLSQPVNMTAKPGVAMSAIGLPGRQGIGWRRRKSALLAKTEAEILVE